MTTYTYVARNKFRSILLILVFITLIIGIGYLYDTIYGGGISSVIFAFLFALVSGGLGYYFSDQIALAVNGAKPLLQEQDPELFHIVESLSLTVGIPMPRLYLIQDPALNAFATGRNPQNAAIAVTTGLREMMTKSELEGVLAHEMSHIKNYDILFMTLVSVFVGTITMLADWFMRWGLFGGSRRRDNDSGNSSIRLVIMVVGIVLIILSPVIATIIQLAISRKREYLADASGVLITRYPEGLASALEKIRDASQPMERANKATAHMYIANPLKGGALSKLFSTHPPLEERIRILHEMNK